ncbi:Na+/H+ antiporter NhaC family protein, partial [Candidatus Atribacteria bacterium 1244-E10-H5-B2]
MYYWNKYKVILLLTLLIFMFFILSGIALAAEGEAAKNYGFLSLLPPLVAITLCFLTKRVLASLFIGVWVGASILIGWNPIGGVTKTLGYIVENA